MQVRHRAEAAGPSAALDAAPHHAHAVAEGRGVAPRGRRRSYGSPSTSVTGSCPAAASGQAEQADARIEIDDGAGGSQATTCCDQRLEQKPVGLEERARRGATGSARAVRHAADVDRLSVTTGEPASTLHRGRLAVRA